MVKQISSQKDKERALADGLKREAEASRPEFSEALHARIRRAVAESPPRAGRPIDPLRYSPVRRWAYVAAAATVAVAATAIVWQAVLTPAPDLAPTNVAPTNVAPTHVAKSPDPDGGPSGVPQSDPLKGLNVFVEKITGDVPERVDRTMASTLIAGQWAQLDHDARLAASLLTDPLPLGMLASAGDM